MTINPMTAPAKMPGLEEIARVLAAARKARQGGAPELVAYAGLDRSDDVDHRSARAILDLFAPILAEKERARAFAQGWFEGVAKENQALIEKNESLTARALAAEAERDDFMRVAASRGQEIERLKEMRKRLDRRIHCQRKANQDNWEIVEQRRKWLGSQTAQRAWMLQRDRRLAAEAALAAAKEASRQAVMAFFDELAARGVDQDMMADAMEDLADKSDAAVAEARAAAIRAGE